MNYQEIKTNVKKLTDSDKIPNMNFVIPKMVSFQGPLSKKDKTAFNAKIKSNIQDFAHMPESTFEELRNKVGILLGTMYVNEYFVGWGDAFIPNELIEWAEKKVDRYLPELENDEELYDELKENGQLDNFSNLMVNNKFDPDEGEIENVQSWKEILHDSLDDEKHYTIEIILGILFGWEFSEDILDGDEEGDFTTLKNLLLN